MVVELLLMVGVDFIGGGGSWAYQVWWRWLLGGGALLEVMECGGVVLSKQHRAASFVSRVNHRRREWRWLVNANAEQMENSFA